MSRRQSSGGSGAWRQAASKGCPPAPLRLAIGDRAAGAALDAGGTLGLASGRLGLLGVTGLRCGGRRCLLLAPGLLRSRPGGRSLLQAH